MAVNANNEYKSFKYYEGLCSSGNFPKEIAKVLSLGVKTPAIKNEDGDITEIPEIIKTKNWDIVYPVCDSTIIYTDNNGTQNSLNIPLDKNGFPDTSELTSQEFVYKILNQVDKISDTVILKTTTTPQSIADDEYDDLTVDASSNSSSLEMYLEIYKPTYIANPEEYPLDCERQGIIPKLITKDIYKKAFATNFATEENIYANDAICKKENRTSITLGSAILNFEECESYRSKICKIKNDSGALSLPTTLYSSTKIEMDSTYLTKIKQQDGVLYTFILNTLENGIEPKEYNKFSSIEIEITNQMDDSGTTVYVMALRATTDKIVYTIAKDSKYTSINTPLDKLAPEYYLDGIYTPIDTSMYHIENAKEIVFDEDIEFEAGTEGVLVVRYNYTGENANVISDRVTLLNNHYVLMRLFDVLNDEKSGPAENVYNAEGEITKTNSHVSPWSKLSWYRDFEEVLIDTIDDDINTSSIQDGTVLVPLETAGLNSDTKMRYWINTNNDRFSLIIMGNPSLDYEQDRHVISGCYCGKIDSFDDSINDTAGNFALFTSSSTEPCNTTLSVDKVIHKMKAYSYDGPTTNEDPLFTEILSACKRQFTCTPGRTKYEIQLNNKEYFSRNEWPKYIITDEKGQPVTGLVPLLTSPDFSMTNGKSDTAVFTIKDEHKDFDNGHTIHFYYGYFEEKYTITSGVSRDVFGNVIDVDKIKTYGNNTSDGVTSIMMYHTRSKAYYQKHHMLFATTEEYMSKIMYGKSSYTGEYYADRIKVTHGNDGPRGTLSDLLVIDSASLYARDELVINKDFEKDPDEFEETFIYFPITAPYSPLSDSPNATYGLAIKKSEIEPDYADDLKLLKIAINQLNVIYKDKVVGDSFPILNKSDNKCDIYWKVLNGENGSENTRKYDGEITTEYNPVVIAVDSTQYYEGLKDEDGKSLYETDEAIEKNKVAAKAGITLNSGSTATTGVTSYIKIAGTGFTAESNSNLYYGISDTPIDKMLKGTHIRAFMIDNATDDYDKDEDGEQKYKGGGNLWAYNINGIPFTGAFTAESDGEYKIVNASPDKYLIIYSAKEGTKSDEKQTPTLVMNAFTCVKLSNDGEPSHKLLKYPSSVNIGITCGKGKVVDDNEKEVSYINTSVEYDGQIEVLFTPEAGYEIDKVIVTKLESQASEEITSFTSSNGYQVATIKNITENCKIGIEFKKQQ